MTILALDFDGVICDSAEEVLQTALAAWSEMSLDSRPAAAFAQDPEFRTAFKRLVPLGNRAEDFGVALHILSAGLDVVSQDDYNRVRDGLGTEWLSQYHRRFYGTREGLRSADPGRWLNLHAVYPELIDVLVKNQNRAALAIATAKDGESVRRLLRHFEIDNLFDDQLILDKDTGVAKTLHLQALANILDRSPSEITFVDDKLNHLIQTAPLGVRCVLASWGHNTLTEHQAARDAGFAVATLENVDSVLFQS